MERRTLLAAAGFSLTGPLAGCLSRSTSDGAAERDDESEGSQVSDSPSEYPVNSGDLAAFDPEETYNAVDVGGREGVADDYRPHAVVIWNDAAAPEISLRITDSKEKTVVHRETYAIPDDTALSVSLLEPGAYIVEIGIPEAAATHTLRVPCYFFDCNDSFTRVGVFAADDIRSSVLSTTASCPSFEC